MKALQKILTPDQPIPAVEFNPDLILIFGSRNSLEKIDLQPLKTLYPQAIVTGCSTSGTIAQSQIFEDEVVINYIDFEKTPLKYTYCSLKQVHFDSKEVGRHIATELLNDEIKHIFLLSDGLHVNGTSLIKGMAEKCNGRATSSGGLAGDADRFQKTLVIHPQTLEPTEHMVVAIGFYGEHIQIGYGSRGGWESFGIDRKVTKSKNNVVYEIDGQPALQLYKSYLGEKAKELPASALLFPLNMEISEHHTSVVRTILSVNEEEQSMTFAGDIPEGSTVRLMRSNSEKLIRGALQAADDALSLLQNPESAILVSCVGRKLVLRQLAEEELEAVQQELNADVVTGFYSYGELAPTGEMRTCELHNQTMTITTFSEV
ncbi:hypothetical protein JCM31826_18280 [Thermaurantimonas aggregans]|uniref:Histidine kinase n=2 Tax=Thermaurantimonas aggregans TaxID=2173829 RepID=A0A401XMX3_9FLAO|nr:FIST N-terminal domain-containing protein [Thermaurantimonas aggregans]GCD78346.1 hypothetical protein JCM31826_18280 [Thermaurantimonas aggregans]